MDGMHWFGDWHVVRGLIVVAMLAFSLGLALLGAWVHARFANPRHSRATDSPQAWTQAAAHTDRRAA